MLSGILFMDWFTRKVGQIAVRSRFVIFAIAANAQATDLDMVDRGAYLAKVADCVGCHTAGPDHPPFAGGLPINSPFGTIYSTNITPDPIVGIGRYSYDDFRRALRDGIARGGKRLYPA